jgi:SsrA-binding protein
MTVVCQNRKARFDYEVVETVEAGIVLKGTEIKSVRNHRVSLDGAYASVDAGNVTLVGCNIEPYSHGNVHNHEAKRDRRLLLNRSEIDKIASKAAVRGFTLIPLSMYIKDGRAKIELAVCRGRQTHDKRHAIKDREVKKAMKRGKF